ncbi:Short-chain dehydrogenase/reductase sthC [Paramyrothecium foliicola]|nr:Short-chain dehydrogenase/reductase sthC [Paramyrothecium foliicola]
MTFKIAISILAAYATGTIASCAYGTSLMPRAEEGTVKVNTFGYTGAIGPANWHLLDPSANSLCTVGAHQTPIDMINGVFSVIPASDVSLDIPDFTEGSEFENLGTTIEVVAQGGNMTFDGTSFSLAQFHFHLPSEHLDNGLSMAMEMHMVWEGPQGQIAVVGTFIDIADGADIAPAPPAAPPANGTDDVAGAADGGDPAALHSPMGRIRLARRKLFKAQAAQRRETAAPANGAAPVETPAAASQPSTLLETVFSSVGEISTAGTITKTGPLVMSEVVNLLASGSFQTMINQFYPPSPTFTEEDVPDQTGRTFIVTGGTNGIGYELSRMLYETGATVYLTSRSKARAEEAIKKIIASSPKTREPGRLRVLQLDLNDLNSARTAALQFKSLEAKLDVLIHNAGTSPFELEPQAKTMQGLEAMVGMHCVAPLLLTTLLLPELRAAVNDRTAGTVRIVWAASISAEFSTPKNGVDFSKLATGIPDVTQNYGVSKWGNWALAKEMARRYGSEGIFYRFLRMGSKAMWQPGVPEELESDNRDVADLWKQALQNYKGIVGFDLERKFENVQGMIDYGTVQMQNFHKFRHNEKKVDKLRTVFASNLDLLEKGAQQLISAAAPAFPPAAAIGTALTFVLQACRTVSADYDVVVVFFDDMNSFLQRIVILESRLPSHKAYQNCLMEVFSSFLKMCGFAHKYIELGRFKKWISNLLQGEDSDLAGARKDMDKNLSRLQNATEFAILGNTEETKKMAAELRRNSQHHTEMLEEQREVIGSIQSDTASLRSDMAKLLKVVSEQRAEQRGKSPTLVANKPPSSNRIRNSLPTVEGEKYEFQILKETMMPDSCTWILTQPEWQTWTKQKEDIKSILTVSGSSGTGKSHIAASIYHKLLEEALSDSSQRTCAAHFYFREQQAYLSTFLYGLVTIINQISEQSAPLCERLNAEMFRDEIMYDPWSWKDLLHKILGPIFTSSSKNRLLLVLDGLDEMADGGSFFEFAQYVLEKKLSISIVVTCRSDYVPKFPENLSISVLEVTKTKQLQDLKALIWHRMKQLDNLQLFDRYVQQRIAVKVEEGAPNLLYAEHLLVRLNNLGREGAVLQVLNKPLPGSLHDLYEISLAECQRRMPDDHQRVVSALLHWLAFSTRAFTLNEVKSLLKYLSNDDAFDLEEIPEFMTKFLRIGDPGIDAQARVRIRNLDLDIQDVEKAQEDDLYDDGRLPVKFQERAMRSFFREIQKEDTVFRWRPSEAQRQIFRAIVEIAQVPKSDSVNKFDEGLKRYAAFSLLTHWIGIEIDSHTIEQQAEVLELFAAAMSNRTNFATVLSRTGIKYKKVATSAVNNKIVDWAKLLDQVDIRSRLSTSAIKWWEEVATDPRKCRLGLAKGFLAQLYRAANLEEASRMFELVKGVLEVSDLDSLLRDKAKENFADQFSGGDDVDEEDLDDIAPLGLIDLFPDDVPMDATAYRAVAEVLLDHRLHSQAEATCLKAREINDAEPVTVIERCKTLILLAQIRLKLSKRLEARQTSLECIQLMENRDVPKALKQQAWIVLARSEGKDQPQAASKSYREARAVDPTSISGEALVGELLVFQKRDDKVAYIETLKSLSDLERLTWLTWNYSDDGEDRQCYFRDFAAATNEGDFMISVYEQSIKYLDNLNASAPLRVDLASAYKEVIGDLPAARKVLEEVFNLHSDGWPYPVTEEEPQNMLQKALVLMTDVLFHQFFTSRDPKVKNEAFVALKDLTKTPLVLDVPPYSPIVLMHQRITVATMSLKFGHGTEFQAQLQAVFDDCFEALSDKVGWNDGEHLEKLGHALAILSRAVQDTEISGSLRIYARIAISAMFSRMNPQLIDEELEDGIDDSLSDSSNDSDAEEEEPPQDQGDLANHKIYWTDCEGICNPPVRFRWWHESPAYYCLSCSVVLLCEPCYEKRQAANNGEHVSDKRNYCGQNHNYLKLPVEGWRGVKDGKIVLDGQDAVLVDDFLADVRRKINEGWAEFWAGA